MGGVISKQVVLELKPEFLNPNVNRETEEQTAIDRAYARGWNSCNTHWVKEISELSELPSVQQESDKEKISDLLRNLYLFGLVHFTKEGIVRKQHYCEELWKTLFRNDEFPAWMHWS